MVALGAAAAGQADKAACTDHRPQTTESPCVQKEEERRGWKRRKDPGWVKGWLLPGAQLSIVLGKFSEAVLDQTQPATNAPGFVCPTRQ